MVKVHIPSDCCYGIDVIWIIKLYETTSGQTVVEDFIKKLQPATQAKLLRQLDLLTEFGLALGMPHVKPMGRGLYELRVRGKQEVRVFYVFAANKNIYLLHAFQKKSQATPAKELTIARKRQTSLEQL